MRAVIGGAIALAAGGCYKPTIANCQYACDNNTCPAGLVCSAGMCVGAVGESCAPGDAGPNDGQMPDVNLGEAGCAWGYNPSNIDPCSFTGPIGDWIVPSGAVFDTDQPGASGDFPPAQSIHQVLEGGGQLTAVVFVHTLNVMPGATISVTGSRPLLIYADVSATIAGAIDFSAASSTCPATAGRAAQNGENGAATGGGGGGGGGSFGIISLFATVAGAHGGDGGSNAGDAGGNGGSEGNPTAGDSLVPILPGCPGGNGGTGNGMTGGAGGAGGGAIQISTRGALTVTGQIRASGDGGHSNNNNGGGGGGGGSGGAILLEGTTVTLQGGSFVCANGGGGGASATPTPGELGHCAGTVAKGAVSGSGDGGDGEATEFSAVIGQSGAASLGGGGGGGGVGIIRVNGTASGSGGASPHVVTN